MSDSKSKYVPRFKREAVQPEALGREGYTAVQLAEKLGVVNHTLTAFRIVGEVEQSSSPEQPAPDDKFIAKLLIFKNSHPKWPAEVWCHNGHEYVEERTMNFHRPIPVFTELSGGRFKFDGYRMITSIDIVPAQSDELKNMLLVKEKAMQKQSRGYQGRQEDAWAQSLRQNWMRVHLAEVPKDYGTALRNPMELNSRAEIETYLRGLSAV